MRLGTNYHTAVTALTTALAQVSANARQEAIWLLSAVLNVPSSAIFAFPETALSREGIIQLEQALKERLQGKPLAYILGSAPFWEFDALLVNEHVLIPRAATECLVEWVLQSHENPSVSPAAKPLPLQKGEQEKEEGHTLSISPFRKGGGSFAAEGFSGDVFSVLDLGTGTGAIALSLKHAHPEWHIEAVDISDVALQVAIQNAARLNISNITFYQSNWFSEVKNQYDLIISNPPYIAENDPDADWDDLQFEPKSALVSQEAGLADIHHIIATAPQYLIPGGALAIEHGFKQGEAVRKCFAAAGFTAVQTHQDKEGLARFTVGKLSS